MRILICDDDGGCAEQLRDCVREYFDRSGADSPEIAVYASGDALLRQETTADIAFLDVEMPGRSGIETGAALKQRNPHILLFVVTSYPDYLDDAMRVQVFRYLSKPIDKNRLHRNLQDAVRICNTERRQIPVETPEGIVTVWSNEIVCVETDARKTLLYTTAEKYRTILPLHEWRVRLDYPCFFSPHRSYLINMYYVSEVRKDKILLRCAAGTVETYLTRRKYREFRDTYLSFMESVR